MRTSRLVGCLGWSFLVACQRTAPQPTAVPVAYPPPPPVQPQAAAPPASFAAPCAAEGGYDCTPDRKALTVCRGGRSIIASTCRGARGCVIGQGVDCDHSVAAVNDPCDGPKEIACALDAKQMLRCVGGTYQPAEACRNACLSTSGRVLCQ